MGQMSKERFALGPFPWITAYYSGERIIVSGDETLLIPSLNSDTRPATTGDFRPDLSIEPI